MSDEKNIAAIAKTIYNEARGEGKEGMQAVAATIQNRYDLNRSYMGNKDYNEICSKGYEGYIKPDPNPKSSADIKAYDYCKELAKDVLSHKVVDTTDGSTHFDKNPNSFQEYISEGKMIHTKDIGHHHFHREK